MSTEKYDTAISELVQLINSSNVSLATKGEFFGYFVDRLVHRYIQMADAKTDQFNANLFPAGTRKGLDLLIGRLATLLGAADPVDTATDLRHVIQQVAIQVCTQTPSGFGMFLQGCVHRTLAKIQLPLDTSLGADPKDRVMASRRRVVATGVLAALW